MVETWLKKIVVGTAKGVLYWRRTLMINSALLLLGAMLAGCDAKFASGLAPEAVAAQFAQVWRACGTPLQGDGGFDRAAVVKAGWTLKSRKIQHDAEERILPSTDAPVLQAGEIESTEWMRLGSPALLQITRWDLADGRRQADRCELSETLDSKSSADVLANSIVQILGRAVDRKGETARGGDFLAPRNDAAPRAWYWQMPQHDVYLLAYDGADVTLEILAMPNRQALYDSMHNEPTRRIFEEDQKL